jgi:hypothetical protein
LSKEVIDRLPNITDHHQIQKVLDEEKNGFKVSAKPPAPPKKPSKDKPK